MLELFCTNVERDLSKCAAHLIINNRNSYQAPVLARSQGWTAIGFDGYTRCPEHSPKAGPKVKK